MLAVNFLVNLEGRQICCTTMGGDIVVGLLLAGIGGTKGVPVFNV